LLTVLALECIFTGLSEEGLYRGIVLNALRGYGLLQAVLVSSLLFGMMHINYFSAGILTGATVVIYTSLFGICCAALRICTGTIWLPIVFHALNNYLLQLHRTDSRLLFGARPAFWPENAAYTLLLDSILAIYGLFILKRYSGDALADGLPFGEVHRNNGVTQSRQDQ
jgi:membrane protease YdiL (CAAX protease family)